MKGFKEVTRFLRDYRQVRVHLWERTYKNLRKTECI